MGSGLVSILGWAALLALATVMLCVPAALAMATWMARQRWRTSALFDVAILLPAGLPPALAGLAIWLGWRRPELPWLWAALRDWTPLQWVGATLAACCLLTLPWMVRLLRPAFEARDPMLAGVARTLGASAWRAWWTVSLPLARPALVSALALGFAVAFSEALIVMVAIAALTPEALPGRPDWLRLLATLRQALQDEQTWWLLAATAMAVSFVGVTLSEWGRRAWRRQAQRQRTQRQGPA